MLYTVDDCIGVWRGQSAWKESNRVNRIDLMTPMAEWEHFFRMPNQFASSARIFVLGGMFYCLGGFLEWDSLSNMEYDKLFLSLNREQDELPPPPCLDIDKLFSASKPSPFTMLTDFERLSPWAMAYDPSSIFSAAGEVPNPFIMVGLPEDHVLLIYHVNTKKWERGEFEICPKFSPYMFGGPALAVDSKLYWYSGNIPINDCGEDFRVMEDDTPPRLAHISGNKFCLLWVSVLPHGPMKTPESIDDCISRIHCMKLQVTIGNLDLDSKIFPLEVSILSCQSYLVPGLKFFRDGLVVECPKNECCKKIESKNKSFRPMKNSLSYVGDQCWRVKQKDGVFVVKRKRRLWEKKLADIRCLTLKPETLIFSHLGVDSPFHFASGHQKRHMVALSGK
ncbi:unnamed protein product [Camellia sinensis]